MKRIFSVFFTASLIMTLLILPISASESGSEIAVTEAITEAVAETAATEAVIGSEEASAVIDIIENSGSKAEAIIALAEELGITVEEAEQLINAVLMVGDKYLGESEIWVKFSKFVTEDIKFWTLVVVLGVASISMVIMIIMMAAKVNPNTRKTRKNSEQTVKFNEEIAYEISQTLEKMQNMFIETIQKNTEFKEVINSKEEKITALETEYSQKSKDMLISGVYVLRMLKLICDRTAMPLADKSIIDVFYAKGVEALKKNLSESDAELADKVLETLERIGK